MLSWKLSWGNFTQQDGFSKTTPILRFNLLAASTQNPCIAQDSSKQLGFWISNPPRNFHIWWLYSDERVRVVISPLLIPCARRALDPSSSWKAVLGILANFHDHLRSWSPDPWQKSRAWLHFWKQSVSPPAIAVLLTIVRFGYWPSSAALKS